MFSSPDGYYDDKGTWRRAKFCFVDCGDRCTCKPPMGVFQLPSVEPQTPQETHGPLCRCRECPPWKV